MAFLKYALTPLVTFFFLLVVFLPMEKVFPAKKGQAFFRKGWTLDLCYFLGQYLLWSFLVLWLLELFDIWLSNNIAGSWREVVSSWSMWIQVPIVVILSDFLIYWGHRWQHHNEFLWRFHKVHHSAERMDWLAAHREHPLDSIYTIGLINLPALILGFPIESIAWLIAFRGIWAVYIHSNVRLEIGPIKKLIGSPDLHHWHHDLDRRAGNYANISPLMDILFGTYVCPDHEPEKVGIKEETPSTYLGQLIEPFQRQKSENVDRT